MAKVATGIQILRERKSTVWTSDLDAQMVNWTSTYITWVTTAKIALEEKAADKYVILCLSFTAERLPFVATTAHSTSTSLLRSTSLSGTMPMPRARCKNTSGASI